MPDNDAEFLVLGAGAAGLTAARELARHGKTIVLEARDRVGGRLHTIRPTGHPIPIEMGPEFIHGDAVETFSLLDEAGLIAHDIPDRHFDGTKRPIIERSKDWEAVEELMGRLTRVRADRDISFAAFLEKFGGDVPQRIKTLASSYVEGFNAARKEEISCRSILASNKEEEKIGETQYRLIGGYDQIPTMLAKGLGAPSRIDLLTVAERVEYSARGVTVTAKSPAGFVIYHAKKAVIALPLGVMQTGGGGPTFEPALKIQHVLDDQLRMGPVTKIVLRFRTAWWEDEADGDLSFVHGGANLPFPTWWTTLPLRTRQLTGWAGGAAADKLPRAADALLPLALQSLAAIFGKSISELARQLEAVYTHDWLSDPFARGAYSYAVSGGAGGPDLVAAAGDGVLFFAGEHTHRGLIGTVAAALESGKRAARAILE